MIDPDTVGVFAKGLHGSVHLWEKLWEVGNPEVAQILSGPKGSSDLWGELVVVVGQVPDQPQQVSEGIAGVGASLTGVPFYLFLEHWAQSQNPGVVNHFAGRNSIEMKKSLLLFHLVFASRASRCFLCFSSRMSLTLFRKLNLLALDQKAK